MKKNDEYTCKGCKTIVFRRQICKSVAFLLPSSLWLLKVPIIAHGRSLDSSRISNQNFSFPFL